MILPVVKLGTLALKILCKPIAGRLKKEAGIHPKFRQFIISFAQANHRITTNIQRCIYGHSTNVEIQPLNEEKAVQAVADLIGEICLFGSQQIGCSFEC
ncbi:OPA3-like protein isoform X2 [Elaeis guineensis]|uniref:OPA3-like protein isoform X2 n=1 Tax=Elaeis guineensis var. tenera TaxID=51953 RepID=UPI003C6D669B